MGTFLFSYALGDFLRLKRVVVWVLIALFLYVLARVFLWVGPESSPRDTYATLSGILVFRLLPLASAIFSTGVISQEVEQKTIVYLLTRPVKRSTLLFARSLASITVVAGIGILSAIAVSVAVFGAGALSSDLLYRDMVAIVVGSLAYGSLFVLVSLLINRAMIICLLFAFAWETSVPNMPGEMYKLSITSYLTAIAERPASSNDGLLSALSGALNPNTIAASTAWPVMLLLIAFCTVFGAWWFTKFEYVPREDAE
jgi:ABC-2 type transport system permease protein